MSIPQRHAIDAVTQQMVAALDRYELEITGLCDQWPDLDRYGTVSRTLDELRAYNATLMELSVPFVALLIEHTDLMQALWEPPGHGPRRLGQCRERHQGAAALLRRRAQALLATGP